MKSIFKLVACLFLCVSLNSFGAYYVKTDGSIVDPIKNWGGVPHPYNGNNLEPYADLELVNLDNAHIPKANLLYANLVGANLSETNLFLADLSNTNLVNSRIRQANLMDTNFTSSDLTGADLSDGTDMSHTNFTNADLTNANLTNTKLFFTNFSYADLSGVNFSGAVELQGATPTWSYATFTGAKYNNLTTFAENMNPQTLGMTFVPLPAGITLFLSGLVGLGLMRGRNA